MVRRFVCAHVAALVFSLAAASCPAEIFVPGQTVPNVSGEVFTWSSNDLNSTYAYWTGFDDFPGGDAGGIAPGISPGATDAYNDGGTDSSLTFNSFAVLLSGNAYGFNFAPGLPPVQPEFITDAFATVRSGNGGGDFTRIVAQWQTLGSELDTESILLSFDTATEGTLAPDLLLETERVVLGGFGGERVNRMAVWDLDTSQEAFRVDFNAAANHMSFDEFRLDTFTQGTAFTPLSAVPEPGAVLALGLLTTGVFLRRRRNVLSTRS